MLAGNLPTVMLATLDTAWPVVSEFEELFRQLTLPRFRLVADPEAADMILFTECHLMARDPALLRIRRHPLVRRFPGKVLVYDSRDHALAGLPGMYVSLPRAQFDQRRYRASSYHRHQIIERGVIDPTILFSFVGSPSHPLRKEIYKIKHSRGYIDQPLDFTFYDKSSPNFVRSRANYREVIQDSKFVLCPRGAGTSSIRMLETLSAGRVPVVISDDWVPPTRLDWASIAVLWPERQIDMLPAHLEDIESDWAAMSLRAASAYDEWFSNTQWLGRLIDDGFELLPQSRSSALRSGAQVLAAYTKAAQRRLT